MVDKERTRWCEYGGGDGRLVPDGVCAWHIEERDPACRECEHYNRVIEDQSGRG